MPYKSADKNRQYQRDWYRRKARERVAAGRCASCGGKLGTYGWRCDDCAEKRREGRAKPTAQARLSICESCEQPILDDYSIVDGDTICHDCR